MKLLNKIKSWVNRPKQIMKKGQKIKLKTNQIALAYKAKGFKYKDICKVNKDCVLKFEKNTFSRVQFKVLSNCMPFQNEAGGGDIIYFPLDDFKTIEYKYKD